MIIHYAEVYASHLLCLSSFVKERERQQFQDEDSDQHGAGGREDLPLSYFVVRILNTYDLVSSRDMETTQAKMQFSLDSRHSSVYTILSMLCTPFGHPPFPSPL